MMIFKGLLFVVYVIWCGLNRVSNTCSSENLSELLFMKCLTPASVALMNYSFQVIHFVKSAATPFKSVKVSKLPRNEFYRILVGLCQQRILPHG